MRCENLKMSACVYRRKAIMLALKTRYEGPILVLNEITEMRKGEDTIPREEKEEVLGCKPCRPYTKGAEKPSWAIHGCPGKGHKNKTILHPQLPAEERPKRGWTVRLNGSGFSCVHPECQAYTKIYPSKQSAQQHVKKHYPPEYRCSDCEGGWYLKTEYNYHFLAPCSTCKNLFMKTSLSAHAKICKKK